MEGSLIYILYAAIFVGVIMLVEGIYLLFSDPTKDERIANQRMQLINDTDSHTAGLMLIKRAENNSFGNRLSRILPNLNGLLWAANVKLTAVGFIGLVIIIAFILSAMMMVLGNLPFFIAIPIAIVLGVAFPFLFLMFKAAQRRKLFSEQLCPAIDLVCRSLQAGHPAVVALEMVSKEMPDPIGTEFGIAMDQTNYGMDRNDALSEIATRFPDPDLRFFISALEIQRNTGANLVEILQNLTKVIRDRIGMRKKIVAMSAEGRFTAIIVGLLPFVIGFLISVINPTHYTEYGDDPLQIMLLIAPAVLYVLGMTWLWRMVNIKV